MGETTDAFPSATADRKMSENGGRLLAYGEEGLDAPGCPGAWFGQEGLGLATDAVIGGGYHSARCPPPSGPGVCSGQPQARESQQS